MSNNETSGENKGIMVTLILPKGIVVHIGGIPVGLKYDGTYVEVNAHNVPLLAETLSAQQEQRLKDA